MPWFEYTPTSGSAMPFVDIQLLIGGNGSFPIDFLVDSGASLSTVPWDRIKYLLPGLPKLPEVQDSGTKDANRNPLKGVPLDFDVRIRGTELPIVRERIWVMPSGGWPLLGQTWFERFVVHFHNFPAAQKGRRFYIHPSSLPPVVPPLKQP